MGTEEELLREISTKLDQMLRLSALQVTNGMKQVQAIQLLSAVGLGRSTIAELLNTTPGTVSVTLAKAKAKTKPKEAVAVEATEAVAVSE